MLRWPVSVRILRHAKNGKRDTSSEGKNSHTELEFHLPHFVSAVLSASPATASYMRCGCCESDSSSDCTGDGKSFSGSKFCSTS